MTLARSIPDVELCKDHLPRTSPEAPIMWSEIPRQNLSAWNEILLTTDTSLYQYPFWNEPHRPLLLFPRYLVWGNQARPLAFVSVLTVGFGPFKVGLVFRGPICIHSSCARCRLATTELVEWAREHGYMFIRFTHSDSQVLRQLAVSGHAEDFDAFPYFLDYPVLSPDYVVAQHEDEEQTLAGFDREVRRKLRRASEMGYEIRTDDSADALAAAWHLYLDCARRKQFRIERPLSVYMETIRQARPHGCVGVYSAYLNGKLVGSNLVFRDATAAHSHIAAFDPEHRHAAVLLHWHAMRDMYRRGTRFYNMGPGPGTLAQFKQQFCEQPVSYPAAMTVVLNEPLFKIWRKTIFPVAKTLRPTLRKIVSHLKR